MHQERPQLPVDKIKLGWEQVTKYKDKLVSHSWFTGGEHVSTSCIIGQLLWLIDEINIGNIGYQLFYQITNTATNEHASPGKSQGPTRTS